MAMASGYQMGGGGSGGSGYQLAGTPSGASGPVIGGPLALSTPGQDPKTLAQMYEDVDRLRHPEKYMKLPPPREPYRGPIRTEDPRGYVNPSRPGGGGFGDGTPYWSENGSVMDLQEPLQPGMFAGSVTFLSAQLDPHDSELAAAAIVRNEIRGDNIVRGMFARRPKGGLQ